jgi:hypothetical protein
MFHARASVRSIAAATDEASGEACGEAAGGAEAVAVAAAAAHGVNAVAAGDAAAGETRVAGRGEVAMNTEVAAPGGSVAGGEIVADIEIAAYRTPHHRKKVAAQRLLADNTAKETGHGEALRAPEEVAGAASDGVAVGDGGGDDGGDDDEQDVHGRAWACAHVGYRALDAEAVGSIEQEPRRAQAKQGEENMYAAWAQVELHAVAGLATAGRMSVGLELPGPVQGLVAAELAGLALEQLLAAAAWVCQVEEALQPTRAVAVDA